MLTGSVGGLHLTAEGRAQADRIARHLEADPIAHVLSSPLERARETAAPLATAKHVPVSISEAITEFNSGEWTGLTFAELEQMERWRQFNRVRGLVGAPGGETMLQAQARFVGELLRLRDEFPGESLALVSHADPIRAALLGLLGMPVDFYDRLEISVGSISVITLDGWSARLLRLNDVPRP